MNETYVKSHKTNCMKRFCLSFLGAALMALGTVSCSDDPEEKVVPPDVESVAGIEASYAKGQHEYLEITPDVSLSNDNEQGVTYEWNIGYEVVGTEKTLSYKCSKLGDFNGYFKASSATGAKIVGIHAPRLLSLRPGTAAAERNLRRVDALVQAPRRDGNSGQLFCF